MRVEWVLTMRLKGVGAADLFAVVSADGEPLPVGHGKAWNVTARTFRTYVWKADTLLRERLADERDDLIALHVSMRRNLFRLQFEARQYADALRTLESEARLLDLYPRPGDPPRA